MEAMNTARAVMRTNLVTVGPNTSLTKAIELLIEHQISGLPVVGEGSILMGMITEKDMMRLWHGTTPNPTIVSDLMVREVRTFQASDALEDVCDCLMSNSFRRVPILEGKTLVGLISRADLMRTILEVSRERLT